MARKVQVLLVDDLDGADLGDKGETVTFALDGAAYEIDLSDKNAKSLRDSFGRYMQHARRIGRAGSSGSSRRRSGGGSSRSSEETRQARAWLIEQGLISADSRGRISADNWERYRSRHQMTTADAEKMAGGKPVNGTAAKGGATEKAQAPDKAPRGNSTAPAKAAAKEKAPAGTSGLASLLP